MDKIDKIEIEIGQIKTALLGNEPLGIKGMKQLVDEIREDVNTLKAIERKRKKYAAYTKGAIAGAGVVGGFSLKAIWIKILAFFGGFLSITIIYILL